MTSHGTGVTHCPACGERVLYAITAAGDVAVLSPDESGAIAASEDDTGTARCRTVLPGTQLRLGEFLFAPHAGRCEPRLAEVIPLAAARTRRRPAPNRRYA